MHELLESRRLLSYTAAFGDANKDARVNSIDFNIVAAHFNSTGPGLGQTSGDFNADNAVNALDFGTLASNYGRAIPAFDPVQFVPGLRVSLDADDILQADKSAVAQWNPSNGTSFAAIQPSSAAQPRLRLGALNGHNGVEFDGLDDVFQISNAGQALNGAASAAFVFDNWEDNSYTLLGTSTNQGVDLFYHDGRSYCGAFRQTRLAALPIAFPRAGSHVLIFRSRNGLWNVSLDGQTIYTTTNNTFAADNLWYLGAWSSTDFSIGPGSLHGLISRVLIYDRVISDDDVEDIGAWAIQRYELNQGILPPDPVWDGGDGKRFLHVYHHPFREKIWIGESDDGIDVVNEGKISISGYDGPARDPSYFFADGVHYIAFSNTSVITYPGSVTDHFSVIRSTDGVHWSFAGAVSLSSIYSTPGNNFTWAPQWFQDDDQSIWLIVTTSDDQATFRFYAVPVNSLSPLQTGTPRLIDQPLTNAIDAQIVKVEGKYRLLVAPGAVRVMDSDNLLGPYSSPVQLPQGREGPCWLRLDNEVRIYFDAGGSRFFRSTDGGATFSALLDTVRSRYPHGHGDVIDRWG